MSSVRIAEFDTWRPLYGGDTVTVYLAGSTTLAAIYTDEALTASAANPQTLTSFSFGDVLYGRFAAPLYVGTAYELGIGSIDHTGIIRVPLITLDGVDASEATVQVEGGTKAVALEDHLARRIDARDFGDFIPVGGVGASSATNAATLALAGAAASATGGGYVELPGGTYAFTSLTVPDGVVYRGLARVATTLQSTLAGNATTIGGSRAGFARLTLDGVTLVGGSVGIYAANKTEMVLDDVEVKRFETGIYRKGGLLAAWRNLSISNCTNGAKLHGDLASGAGSALSYNRWDGGNVTLCGSVGIELKYVDTITEHNKFHDILFSSNTATAVKISGARSTSFRECWWVGNTNHLTVEDGANSVVDLEFSDGLMSGGTITLGGTLQTVAFRRMALGTSVVVTLTTPSNNIHVEDCRETNVAIAGDTTAWRRENTGSHNAGIITTIDATATKAWAITLVPGQHVYLEMKAVGRRRNGTDYEFAHKAASARRPGSTLVYELQTGNFTVGNVLTGGTSAATARIVGDVDAGATGTLTLYDIVGTFVAGEIITDGSGGSASVNGSITNKNCVMLTDALLAYDIQTVNYTVGEVVTGGTSGAKGTIILDTDAGATGTLKLNPSEGTFIDDEALTGSLGGAAVVNGVMTYEPAAYLRAIGVEESVAAYYAHFVANGPQVEVRCVGAAGHTLDWTVDVVVTSNYRAL